MIALLMLVFGALVLCTICEHPEYENNKKLMKLAKESKARKIRRRINERRRWDPNDSRY